MFKQLAQLPHLLELEFIPADRYADRAVITTRKAIRQFLPDYGVHPPVVTSAGLDYKLGPVEEAGKSCLRYNPCGSEEYNPRY
jgi:hypothetical protein